METPKGSINFVPVTAGEVLKLGTITIRILEDGSRTDNRIGTAEFTVPPRTKGPLLTGTKWSVNPNLPCFPIILCLSPKYKITLVSHPFTVYFQHDEVFLVLSGKLRFHAKDATHVDAGPGEQVTVPTRAPHTFENPFDEEAKFYNTFTPAFYINYFKLLATMATAGEPMDPAANKRAMAYFATIGVDGPM